MSKGFVVGLLPIASLIVFVIAGCGLTTPATDKTDPLPRLFDNKDVMDLDIPDFKGFGPGSGTGTGGGMGGGGGSGMGKRDHPHDKKASEAQPGSGVDSAPTEGKQGGETEKKQLPDEPANPPGERP